MYEYLQRSHSSITLVCMVFIVVVLGICNLLFGELVPAGGGLGWDGVTYADMVRRLGSMISNGELSRYYSQRFLPSLIVRMMLEVAGADLSDQNIIRGFELLNLLALVLGTLIWKRMADLLSIRTSGQWIGFASLFLNYFATKHLRYAPVTTDGVALLVNLLLIWLYLEKWPLLLLAATIAGSFVWQLSGVYGAILLISLHLKPQETGDVQMAAETLYGGNRETRAFWAFIAIAMATISIIALSQLAAALKTGSALHELAIFLTGLPSLVVVVFALWILIGPVLLRRSPFAMLADVPLHCFLLAGAALLIPQIAFTALSNPDVPNPSGVFYVLKLIVFPLTGRGKFLMAFLAATLLWGPAVLLVMLRWKDVSAELRKVGLGPVGVVAATLPLILVTESRFILGAWPILVLGLALALDRSGVSKSLGYVFGALTILNTQLWLKFNIAPWEGNDYADLAELPKQMFFLHYGPWMGWPAYLLQLPLVIFAAYLLWIAMRVKNPACQQ
ncbi:hypothetical protein JQ554_13240 [Bradyrhizobium diazoefficiens]|nr:hypothetical protein [Bradyrhizobium diazoefficiens]UCF52828.1 MAG: hypothetical protein JSV48_27315 [Bradyrhizobium sp.]MBR0964707.1 hypothetical protein [Bradyrhizobium diazoefficiens]MBR0978880.1 hypothetical protein [Bradyrhizobium diazoefficiens]MBR1006694.1 hypothetical protein [Bradyrhizobium diazoefficiens]MBR1014450.1 hypothetical protein [Bradyrhizobium diazoefficiens]